MATQNVENGHWSSLQRITYHKVIKAYTQSHCIAKEKGIAATGEGLGPIEACAIYEEQHLF